MVTIMKTYMMNRFIAIAITLLTTLTLLPTTVMAVNLQEAKAQGLVGEQASGYLGVIKSSAEVEQLVKSVNQARQQHYNEIAQRNNTSVDIVEKLAGKKAIELTPPGQFVKPPSAGWVKK